MSNGTPPPVSTATYIIICSGRIDVASARKTSAKLRAAANCAKDVAAYLGKRLTTEDTAPVSVLQHEIMENLSKWSSAKASEKIAEMFAALEVLEAKYGGGSY